MIDYKRNRDLARAAMKSLAILKGHLAEVYDNLPKANRDRFFDGSMDEYMDSFLINLQTSLIKLGYADGDISREQCIMLDILFRDDDLVTLSNKDSGEKLDPSQEGNRYESLFDTYGTCHNEYFKKLVEEFDARNSKKYHAFFQAFAYADAITKTDYLDKIYDDMVDLFKDFQNIDDTDADLMMGKIDKIMRESFINQIDVYKQQYIHAMAGKNIGGAASMRAAGPSFDFDSSPSYVTKSQLLKSDVKKINGLNDKEAIPNAILYLETDLGSGTAFYITKSGLAITCAHVVKDASRILVKEQIGNAKPLISGARVIKIDYQNDIALIQVSSVNHYFLELEDDMDEVKLDDPISIYGYPFGSMVNDNVMDMNISLTKGYVSSRQRKEGANIFLIDISAKAGNSGSPVIDMRTGRVAGILCGSLLNQNGTLTEEINYMRPLDFFFEMFVR
jgi:hypothetical protein